MPDVFISYSRKDGEFAQKLAIDLKRVGLQVWMDVFSIPPGANWSMAISDALNSCQYLVLIVSPSALESTRVRDEWQHFRNREKTIIPFLLHQVESLPFPLDTIQWVDFKKQDYEPAFQQLLNVLKVPVRDVFEWIKIPAGSVTLENYARVDGGTKGGSYNLPAFSISKYPVTNVQYMEFLNAPNGYQESAWWDYSNDSRKWRNEHPNATHLPCSLGDAPCAAVSWYTAVAFCHWISFETHQLITLPTEQQWQRAAQGNSQCLYPWGDKFDEKRCNSSVKMRSSGPTPVTQHLNGGSQYEVMDLSGNVWEWCLTEWGTDRTDLKEGGLRIIRGGAWNCRSEQTLQAAFRGRRSPNTELPEIGFRCVRS